jgi:hypothetical protein
LNRRPLRIAAGGRYGLEGFVADRIAAVRPVSLHLQIFHVLLRSLFDEWAGFAKEIVPTPGEVPNPSSMGSGIGCRSASTTGRAWARPWTVSSGGPRLTSWSRPCTAARARLARPEPGTALAAACWARCGSGGARSGPRCAPRGRRPRRGPCRHIGGPGGQTSRGRRSYERRTRRPARGAVRVRDWRKLRPRGRAVPGAPQGQHVASPGAGGPPRCWSRGPGRHRPG